MPKRTPLERIETNPFLREKQTTANWPSFKKVVAELCESSVVDELIKRKLRKLYKTGSFYDCFAILLCSNYLFLTTQESASSPSYPR